jgi:hypothetical protein
MKTRLLRRAACLVALLAPAAVPAGATAATVNFETPALSAGTAVTTQFAGVTFYAGGTHGASQLPVIDTAGHARSVTHALDITQEPSVEFPHPGVSGTFASTAQTVTVYATSKDATVTLQLDLYNAAGLLVGTSGHVSVGLAYVALTAVSGGFDVARFVVSNQSGAGGQQHDVFVDDLAFDSGAGAADFSLGVPAYAGAGHGSSVAVPLSITRLNGSTGGVTFSFPGLPSDLVASVSPNPASGTSSTAVLTISAASASAYRGTRTITVLGTPANVAVGPATRSDTLAVEVTDDVDWTPAAPPRIELAPCTSTQQPFTAIFGSAFTDPVDLRASSGPGITASVTPPTLPGSGSGVVTAVRGDDTDAPDRNRDAGVVGTSAGGVARGSLFFPVSFVDPVITSAPATVSTPQAGGASSVTIAGTGLCPGSTVAFGNSAATSIAATVTRGAITVPVPRLASDGPITITSPAGRVLTTAAALVRTYRNTNGFSFPNRGWSPSINGEVDAWGPNQVWLNLCPIPGCHWLADGTPSIEYGLFSAIAAPILASGNGSCFGFSLASRRLARHEGPTPSFLHGAETVWQVPLDRTIPHTEHFAFEDGHPEKLIDYIWGQHMLQMSSESLHALLVHSLQLATGEITASDLHGQLTAAFAAGERPLVIIPNGLAGHVVIAYDVDDTPWEGSHRGDYRILVYDNNFPYTSDENSDLSAHVDGEGRSYLEIHQDGSWVFPHLTDGGVAWHGTRLDPYLIEERSFPVHPTMPISLDGLATLIVSGSGRATPDASAKAVRMPILDARAGARLPDAFVADPKRALSFTATPDTRGRVQIGAMGPGVVAELSGQGTGSFALDARGTGAAWSPRDGAGPIDLTLGRLSRGSVFREVELTATTSAGDHVMLDPSGALSIAHSGAPATATLTLTASGGALGAQTFTSAPFRLATGVTTVRADWSRLGTTVPGLISGGRHASLRGAARRAHVLSVAVAGARKGDRATTTVHARVAGGRALASVLALRGRHVVASASGVVRGGVAHVRITLPRSARKLHLTLRAVVVVFTGKRPVGSGSATGPLRGSP